MGEKRNVTVISGKKDGVFAEFKDLDSLKNRIKLNKFTVEDALLVKRAVNDGLAVEKIVFTERFVNDPESAPVLETAASRGIELYKISDGLLSAITATRPLPPVIASVRYRHYSITTLSIRENGAILVTDCVSNPDNLGMILRTADVSGIDGVAVMSGGASFLHKNCIRAARGAVGRLCIAAVTENEESSFWDELKKRGIKCVGTKAEAETDIYALTYDSPVAFVVGNENHGIRKDVLDKCDCTVSIPMLPGRDSLSVGVAAGVLVYEWVRNRR
jgi:TrmH family RNA methyltransferase